MDDMGFHTDISFTSVLFAIATLTTLALAKECSSFPSNPIPVAFALTDCTTAPHDNVPKANSRGIIISLGSPPQELCVLPSTFTNNTFIPTVEVCSSDQTTSFATCASRRGGLLDMAASGVTFSSISAVDDYPPDVNWVYIDETNQFTEKGNITLRLPFEVSLPNFRIKTIEGLQRHNVGHFGLSGSSPVLQRLFDERGLVKGFALDAGSQSSSHPRDGHLILGGYDPGKMGAYSKNFTLANIQLASRRVCFLYVYITELILSRPGLEDVPLVSKGEQIPACIDPYDMLFRFPNRTLQALAQATNFDNTTHPDPSQFLVVEPGLTYPSPEAFNGSLKFTLNNDFVVEIPREELAHPLRGIDRNGSISVLSNITELNVHYEPALVDTAVLGRAFLSKVYLVVEYRSTGSLFRLAKTAAGDISAGPIPFEPDCTNSSNRLSGGQVAGIVIGVVIGVAVLFAGIILCIRFY